MAILQICLIGCLFLFGCSDPNASKPAVRKINKNIVEQSGYSGGTQYLQGKASIGYTGNEGSWQMESTADGYHYVDETQFNDGRKISAETYGQTEVDRTISR